MRKKPVEKTISMNMFPKNIPAHRMECHTVRGGGLLSEYARQTHHEKSTHEGPGRYRK